MMAGLIFLIIIVGIFIFLQYYNPHHWYELWFYTDLLDLYRTFRILPMGQKQEQEEKQKKKIERYNVLRKGKVIFWNVSETEMFDIMEDLAVECYYNKTLTSKDITYEPYIEEPLNG